VAGTRYSSPRNAVKGREGEMLDGWIGTEAGELSDESAVEIIKNWMSLSLQRSEGISDIHAKTGIQRKRSSQTS